MWVWVETAGFAVMTLLFFSESGVISSYVLRFSGNMSLLVRELWIRVEVAWLALSAKMRLVLVVYSCTQETSLLKCRGFLFVCGLCLNKNAGLATMMPMVFFFFCNHFLDRTHYAMA